MAEPTPWPTLQGLAPRWDLYHPLQPKQSCGKQTLIWNLVVGAWTTHRTLRVRYCESGHPLRDSDRALMTVANPAVGLGALDALRRRGETGTTGLSHAGCGRSGPSRGGDPSAAVERGFAAQNSYIADGGFARLFRALPFFMGCCAGPDLAPQTRYENALAFPGDAGLEQSATKPLYKRPGVSPGSLMGASA